MPYESFYRIRPDLSGWNSLALLKADDETSQDAADAVSRQYYCFLLHENAQESGYPILG
jgi:hypothetical protein